MRVIRLALALTVCLACLAAPAQAQIAPRIVGGGTADIEDYPYQVVVTDGDFLCGGAIVDATHVATAAHCVLSDLGSYPSVTPPGELFVGYADDDLANGFARTSDVTSIAVDRRFLRRLQGDEFDSALLTVEPLNLTPPAAAIDLPTAAPPTSGTGLVSGFGDTVEGGPENDDLRAAAVPFVSDSSCAGAYGSAFVAPAMVCAGAKDLDSCQGDSGGPLATDSDGNPDTTGDRELAGIVSFGNGCGVSDFPGVYTEVAETQTRAFLDDDTPGTPPSVAGVVPRITGTLRVGATVGCSTPAIPGSEIQQYLFYRLDPGGVFVSIPGSGPARTVPAQAAGQPLLCDARYERPGGFAYAEGEASAAVPRPAIPAPVVPAADRTRPRARITSIRCRRSRCVALVRASDPGAGVVTSLRARLGFDRRRCRRRGKTRTCTVRRARKRVRASALRGGRFRIVMRRLPARRYRLAVFATDDSGNRQARAATRSFRVRRVRR